MPEEERYICKGTHEAIIDEESFNAVQNILKKNKSFKGTKHDYLFKCLLFCSECGARLIVKTSYYSIKPLTPEDAMLALQEKPTHNFLAFLNVETGKVNVIHRLKDGKNYGLVEPEA